MCNFYLEIAVGKALVRRIWDVPRENWFLFDLTEFDADYSLFRVLERLSTRCR